MNPAATRAAAPVARFATFPILGKTEDPLEALVSPASGMAGILETYCLIWLSIPKYSADPKPVLMTDGVVPRHSWRIGLGPLRTSRRACRSEDVFDCWTRVLRRSAGCNSAALAQPEPSPARK